MTAPRRLAVLALLLFSITLTVACQSKDNSEKWEPLVNAVQNVLAGKPIADKNIHIDPEAYLVHGSMYEHLPSVVVGESKTFMLKEDSSRVSTFLTMRINDPEDAAFLTLKTQTKEKTGDRFHTVVFMKDKKGRWAIHAWHTSNAQAG